MSATATWVLILAKAWSWLKAPSTYEWVKARQKRREEKAKKIRVILSVIIASLAICQGCATCDRLYIWAYEGLNGIPDKPMNEEAK